MKARLADQGGMPLPGSPVAWQSVGVPSSLCPPLARLQRGGFPLRLDVERTDHLACLLDVENVPGADSTIGVGRVVRARPDGYTIEFGYLGANVLNGAFYSLSYDLLRDLSPIALVAAVPLVLYAKASLPAKDVKELIAKDGLIIAAAAARWNNGNIDNGLAFLAVARP
jgi:hypothetical protein